MATSGGSGGGRGFFGRTLEPALVRAAAEFPVVLLTGPRQSGKTTLLRHAFAATHRYVLLDLPDVCTAAASDPRGFLDANPAPVVLDEVQVAGELLPYIKARVDERRRQPGQYLLTGSQNLMLSERVSETLAGRVAVLNLLPLSERERHGEPGRPLPWEAGWVEPTHANSSDPTVTWSALLRGGYPELALDSSRRSAPWHQGYIQTYLERDVRSLRQIGDLTQFQIFLRALAARSGQLLNLAELGRDLGLALNTVKAWISVLEASYQVLVLRPHFANVGKRLVKSPKVYFTDTGTLGWLVGLESAEHAASGPMAGALLETAVINEVHRTLVHRGREARLYFWRTSDGHEVDLVVETSTGLVPIEIKTTSTPRVSMRGGIDRFRAAYGGQAAPGWLVTAGGASLPLGGGTRSVPFAWL